MYPFNTNNLKKQNQMENYLVKAKYLAVAEDGHVKTFTENVLVNAISHGDAENQTMSYFLDAENTQLSEICSVRKKKIDEIIKGNPEADKFFISRVIFDDIIESSGAYKKIKSVQLVQAVDTKQAEDFIREFNKESILSYDIESIADSKITKYLKP